MKGLHNSNYPVYPVSNIVLQEWVNDKSKGFKLVKLSTSSKENFALLNFIDTFASFLVKCLEQTFSVVSLNRKAWTVLLLN